MSAKGHQVSGWVWLLLALIGVYLAKDKGVGMAALVVAQVHFAAADILKRMEARP